MVMIRKETRNDKGQPTYREYSSGYWYKREYDDKGYTTYFENSDGRKISYI